MLEWERECEWVWEWDEDVREAEESVPDVEHFDLLWREFELSIPRPAPYFSYEALRSAREAKVKR